MKANRNVNTVRVTLAIAIAFIYVSIRPAKHIFSFLAEADAQLLIGGDDYDQFALCDQQGYCAVCTPNSCAPNPRGTECAVSTTGTAGCSSYALRTNCYSGSWSQDCWYYYANACGASTTPQSCGLAEPPLCSANFCITAGSNNTDCYNCQTVP